MPLETTGDDSHPALRMGSDRVRLSGPDSPKKPLMPGYTEWTECTFVYLNNNLTILTCDFLNDSPLIATYPERVEEENEDHLCKLQRVNDPGMKQACSAPRSVEAACDGCTSCQG
jgi:hypothetical protein